MAMSSTVMNILEMAKARMRAMRTGKMGEETPSGFTRVPSTMKKVMTPVMAMTKHTPMMENTLPICAQRRRGVRSDCTVEGRGVCVGVCG